MRKSFDYIQNNIIRSKTIYQLDRQQNLLTIHNYPRQFASSFHQILCPMVRNARNLSPTNVQISNYKERLVVGHCVNYMSFVLTPPLKMIFFLVFGELKTRAILASYLIDDCALYIHYSFMRLVRWVTITSTPNHVTKAWMLRHLWSKV